MSASATQGGYNKLTYSPNYIATVTACPLVSWCILELYLIAADCFMPLHPVGTGGRKKCTLSLPAFGSNHVT